MSLRSLSPGIIDASETSCATRRSTGRPILVWPLMEQSSHVRRFPPKIIEKLRLTLNQISKKQSSVVQMYYGLDGMPPMRKKEIAEREKVSITAITNRLRRAERKIEQLMKTD